MFTPTRNDVSNSQSASQSSVVSSITRESDFSPGCSSTVESEGSLIITQDNEEIKVRKYRLESSNWSNRKKTKIVDDILDVALGVKQLKNCCNKECIKLFKLEDIQSFRHSLNSQGNVQKRFLIDQDIQKRNLHPKKKFLLLGEEVCVKCYCYVTGVANHSIYNPLYTKHRYKIGNIRDNSVFLENEINLLENEQKQVEQVSNVRKDTEISRYLSYLKEFNEIMPDSDEIHLPHASKYDVYLNYLHDVADKNPEARCCKSHFMKIWKNNFPMIKIRKFSTFSHCTFCDDHKDALLRTLDGKEREVLKKEYKAHLIYARKEKLCYYTKRGLAKHQPDKYMSIIIDGSDMAMYGLPFFSRISKETIVGYKMLMKLVGVIVHGIGVYVFLVHKNWAADPNLTIEILHKVFSIIKPERGKHLFLQMDNCGKENKNKDIVSYCSYLVDCGLFSKVEIAYLPVGHTHEDIDQFFFILGCYFKTHNALSVKELMSNIYKASNKVKFVQHIESVAQIKQMMETNNWIETLNGISTIYTVLLEKNDNKITLQYKYNVSDTQWLGDVETAGPYNVMLQSAKFRKHMVEPGIPKVLPEKLLKNIEVNINSCAFKIKNLKGDEEGQKCIDELKEELHKLENPTEHPFNWDLSIYEAEENELVSTDDEKSYNEDENEDNVENNDFVEGIEEIKEDEDSIDDGRNTSKKKKIIFSVGNKKKYNKTVKEVVYNVGDLVIMMQDNQLGNAPFLLARLLEEVEDTSPKEWKVWYYVTDEKSHLPYGYARFGELRSKNANNDTGNELEETFIIKFKKLNANGRLPFNALKAVHDCEEINWTMDPTRHKNMELGTPKQTRGGKRRNNDLSNDEEESEDEEDVIDKEEESDSESD